MSKDKNYRTDQDLKKYHDLGGLTIKEMNFGLWLSEKKHLMKKIALFFLFAVVIFFVVYSAYGYVFYFLQTKNANNLLADNAGTIAYHAQIDALAPDAIQIFKNNDRYDLAVNIKNSNDKYNASFGYCFTKGGADIACGQSFILPGGNKYVLALNQELAAGAGGLEFKITSAGWQRVDVHQIPDWSQYAAARLNFSITNINFSNASASGLSAKVPLNTLEFTITDQSSYGYYEVPVNIFFYNNDNLVGVNNYLFKNFKAGETRRAALTWPGDLGGVKSVVIVPDLNIIDNKIFLNYSGAAAAQ